MIPTDTYAGRHAVQVLHEFYGLPAEATCHAHWFKVAHPTWEWVGGYRYRIQPAALREWMGDAEYLIVWKRGGVGRVDYIEIHQNTLCTWWHRSEILDGDPPSAEELAKRKRACRLGFGGASK